MTRAIRIHKTGGPEVMQIEEVTVPAPGAGEARVRHTAIGVNYIDTYHRSGLYPLPMPSGIGSEAAGVVEAVGPGVDFVKAGDRVGYCMGPIGAYSESRVVPAERLIPLPDDIPDKAAAALMLKGLTVQYLFRQTFPLKGGETILFHAAAGGVGLIACQWAKALGVTMIGTAGTDDKAAAAKQAGAAHVIVYTRENFVDRVKEITGGKGVPVVYDCRRKGHVSRFARLPRAARHVRVVRQLVGAGRRVQHWNTGAEGVALRVPAHARHLHREAQRSARDGERALCARSFGEDQSRRAPGIPARTGERCASRAGVAQDDGRDATDSLAGRCKRRRAGRDRAIQEIARGVDQLGAGQADRPDAAGHQRVGGGAVKADGDS